jgi:hypothetical protein
MTRLLWTASLLLLTGPALAQAAPEDKPLRLTVRPSGTEPEVNEALERQQKLLRREWKHQIYAPFDPYAALGRAAQPSDAGN